LKANIYQEIITEYMPEMQELAPKGFLFVHDNSSVHKAATEADLKIHGLDIDDAKRY